MLLKVILTFLISLIDFCKCNSFDHRIIIFNNQYMVYDHVIRIRGFGCWTMLVI